jgi:fatty-acyl-CoA synthase
MRNQSVGGWIARRAEMSPDRVAVETDLERLTYRELLARGSRLAGALRRTGVGHGDRLAYLGGADATYFTVLCAAGLLGAAMVPVNAALSTPEIGYLLGDAEPAALVVTPDAEALAGELRRTLASVPPLLTEGEWAAGTPVAADEEEVGLGEVALIFYTSGTTGHPKGAMLTHANLTWGTCNVLASLDYRSADRNLLLAPLHRTGSLAVALAVIATGGAILLTRAAGAGELLGIVAERAATTLFSGPAVFAALAADPGWASADLHAVRFCLAGGAPVGRDLVTRYQQRGIAFTQAYGLTEASPMVLVLDALDAERKAGSAGRRPLFTEVRIVRPDLSEAEPGEPGEIVARGPNVMLGYWRRPDATAEAITADGWLHTGDIGLVDADGFTWVVDRLKEVIPVGGENVFPAEVERVLGEHPAVAAAAVVPAGPAEAPHPVAFVVRLPSSELDADALLGFAAARLAAYKLPRRIELLEALPMTPAGKVDKRRLRELAAAGEERPRD